MEALIRLVKKVVIGEQSSFLSVFQEMLMKDLAPLGKIDALLLKEVMDYVLKGGSQKVLLKLKRNPKYSEVLQLNSVSPGTRNKKRQIFQRIEKDRVETYLHLLQVYEAAVLADPGHQKLIKLPEIGFWLEIFLCEATGYSGYATYSKFSREIDYHFVEQLLKAAGEAEDLLIRVTFLVDAKQAQTSSWLEKFLNLPGFYASLSKHQAIVLKAINHPKAVQRVQALTILNHEEVEILPFRDKLTELACGSTKTVREAARRIIKNRVEIFLEPLEVLLIKGKPTLRLQAIPLYAELAPERARKFLVELLSREKHERVKSALFQTLADLGESIEEFLDWQQLYQVAEKGTKKIPKQLQWIPFATLPQLYRENGTLIELVIIKRWILLAYKAETLEPSLMLCNYARAFRRVEKELFGKELLEAWLSRANNSLVMKEKGILSFVAVCGGREVVFMVENYLKECSGKQLSQAKVLLQMLAWSETSVATRFLFKIVKSCKTKEIKAQANHSLKEIARHRGLNLEQLEEQMRG